MDVTVLLSAIGLAVGALGGLYSAYTGTANKRLELVFQGQGQSIAELRQDKLALENRVQELEKVNHSTQQELLACERKSHRLEMKVDRLMGMIPNGTAAESAYQKSDDPDLG